MRLESFSSELSFQRGKNGLTQKQLADRLNVSDRAVKLWEAGESIPRKGVRIQMAQVLGLPQTYFLQKEEIPSSAAVQDMAAEKRQLQLVRGELADCLADMDIPENLKQLLSDAIDDAIQKANEAVEYEVT